MLNLLVFRDRLKNCYGKYCTPIDAALRFFTALAAMTAMNMGLGYMKTLRSPAIVLVLALISAVCPWGGICWMMALFMLAHIFAVSQELAAITAAFLLIVALLYYGFEPGDSWVLLITPLLFALKIPLILPVLVGLSGALVSVIPLSCGVVIYYILQYVKGNAGPLTNGDSVDVTQKFVQMLNGIVLNRVMILYIIAFAATAIVVWLVHRLSVDHAWDFAVLLGIIVMMVIFLGGVFLYGISLEIIPLIGGCVLAGLIAELYRFFVFSVDYTRTEYTRFEDDDYYYYVKAVPKITVSAPDPRVQKINTPKRPRKVRGRETETKR